MSALGRMVLVRLIRVMVRVLAVILPPLSRAAVPVSIVLVRVFPVRTLRREAIRIMRVLLLGLVVPAVVCRPVLMVIVTGLLRVIPAVPRLIVQLILFVPGGPVLLPGLAVPAACIVPASIVIRITTGVPAAVVPM